MGLVRMEWRAKDRVGMGQVRMEWSAKAGTVETTMGGDATGVDRSVTDGVDRIVADGKGTKWIGIVTDGADGHDQDGTGTKWIGLDGVDRSVTGSNDRTGLDGAASRGKTERDWRGKIRTERQAAEPERHGME